LKNLGTCIRKTQECYDDSLNKLKTGRGNLIRQVEMIKELGVRSSKSLPYDAIEDEDKLSPEVEPLSLQAIEEEDYEKE
jgi:DNA recombination protein RmuC